MAPAPGRRSNARLEPLFDRFITVQVAVGLRFPAGGGAKGHHFAVAVSEADVERRHGAVRQAVVVVVAHALAVQRRPSGDRRAEIPADRALVGADVKGVGDLLIAQQAESIAAG